MSISNSGVHSEHERGSWSVGRHLVARLRRHRDGLGPQALGPVGVQLPDHVQGREGFPWVY